MVVEHNRNEREDAARNLNRLQRERMPRNLNRLHRQRMPCNLSRLQREDITNTHEWDVPDFKSSQEQVILQKMAFSLPSLPPLPPLPADLIFGTNAAEVTADEVPAPPLKKKPKQKDVLLGQAALTPPPPLKVPPRTRSTTRRRPPTQKSKKKRRADSGDDEYMPESDAENDENESEASTNESVHKKARSTPNTETALVVTPDNGEVMWSVQNGKATKLGASRKGGRPKKPTTTKKPKKEKTNRSFLLKYHPGKRNQFATALWEHARRYVPCFLLWSPSKIVV